ncbi:flagellar hook-associated protein FlgK [Agaribacterium haliotis]|uniref:flagellar hook-associated protein FlgK n=1 Tax=Agaribacterium haliotis TaxID=2013869 RepID=UPI000BB55610|nr:flagellar hook-associated protein FlgK [Agaribacterium haliotis]
MSSDLLGTAVTGLRVSQSALSTTGHNIANAGVDGYSRQRVLAETAPATPQGGFYVGNGASVASVERQVNQFLVQQLRVDTTLYNELEVFHSEIAQLDSLLSDASTGLSGAFESFFAAMQNGADDPTSIPARQLIISESINLADRFNTIHSRLVSINDGINSALETAAAEVNALVANVAELNSKIADALGSGNGEPNDLMDQRDQTLKELSKYISFQTYDQGFGEINILIANGQNLVVGSEARQIAVVADPENPSQRQLVFVGDEAQRPLPEGSLGGEIGGLFRFRDDALADTYNQVGRVAVVLTDSYNDMHHLGLDLNNNFGGDFFLDVNDRQVTLDRVIASSENPPPNDRVMSLYIRDAGQLSTSDYRVEMVNDGLYTVTRLSDGAELVRELLPGSYPFSVEFDGMELYFERGSFQAGDSFLLQPVRNGARDFESVLVSPDELAFALPLLTDASLGNRGSADISAGQLLSLSDAAGNALPLFATPGQISPPLLVNFISDSIYEVLDNSDPANPQPLNPPMSMRDYVPGTDNFLFSSDPGETQVLMDGASIGLPAGSVPVIGGGPLFNGYPSEVISIERPPSASGGGASIDTVTIPANASARAIASLFSNIEGVESNASSYAELSATNNLSLSSPLQININGEDLIEYEFDPGLGTFVIAANVPDPATDEVAFNQYLEQRINDNSNLQALGFFAKSAVDAATGIEELRIYAAHGDDIQITLEADNTGPDTMNVSDGINPVVALDGQGVGVTAALAVGGTLDLFLPDGVAFPAGAPVSALFGDPSAAGFAQSTYLGIQVYLRGEPAANDTFSLDFNIDAASDNRNALSLVELEAQKTVGQGVLSYSDAYAALVETVGIDTSSSGINRDAAEQVLEQSQKLRDSISGVNLDEEASDLIRFEQMYAANAQVISVARELFNTLIGSF